MYMYVCTYYMCVHMYSHASDIKRHSHGDAKHYVACAVVITFRLPLVNQKNPLQRHNT